MVKPNKFLFETLTDYLNDCSYDEIDYDNILEDVISSINSNIDTIQSRVLGFDTLTQEQEQEINECYELLEWISNNLEDARLESLDWYDNAKEEDTGVSSWINEEPRVFGYGAYIDATSGDFSSSRWDD
jgi:hypothetical protein